MKGQNLYHIMIRDTGTAVGSSLMPASNEQEVNPQSGGACVSAATGLTLGDLPRLLEALPHLSSDEADCFVQDISVIQSSVQHEARPTAWE